MQKQDTIKKVVLVVPTLTSGGMERVMSELANFFVAIPGTQVDLVLLSKKEHFYHIDERVTIHEPSSISGGIIGQVKMLSYLRSEIRRIAPEAILGFGEMFNSFLLLSTIGLPYKVFVSDRSRPSKDWGFFHNNFRKIIYRRSYGIIAQTGIAKQMTYERTKHDNITVIGNPIRGVNVSPADDADRSNIVLSVGRLIKSKRYDRQIKLFAAVKQPGWKLHIVGEGPERAYLEDIIAKMGLQEDVILCGNNKNIDSFYRSAKIFAFTSNSEGFPNVLGEAMAAGLAVVTYDFEAGATDLITNGEDGVVVPMDDDEAFKAALLKLMTDPSLVKIFSERAIIKMKRFDINHIGRRYYDFLIQ